MEKRSNERWADYAARRLESEGVDLTPYVAVDGFGNGIYERIHRNDKWDLKIGFTMQDPLHVGTKNQPNLTPSTRLEDILEETIWIDYHDGTEKEYGSIEFQFEGDSVVTREVETIYGISEILDRYMGPHKVTFLVDVPENERTFPAQDFIEDLVLFAEEFKGKPNLAYRKMDKNFEFNGGL